MDDALVCFNGVNGDTGRYLYPPLVGSWLQEAGGRHRVKVLLEDADPALLSSAGWGAIFGEGTSTDVRRALAPLLRHRREAAGRLYREFRGKGELLQEWERHGPGPIDPEILPYYLLIVGGPDDIPFGFQYRIGVQHAVGRICFERIEDYASYARNIVNERRGGTSPHSAFFATRHAEDWVTQFMADQLVIPLQREAERRFPHWKHTLHVENDATKENLARLLLDAPAFLFCAAHGIGYDRGHRRQCSRQGALLCQRWTRHEWSQPVGDDLVFAAEDLDPATDLNGCLAFLLACHSAGTPELDDFNEGRRLSDGPFLASLPLRMLAHGALGVIGHIDRAWEWSFRWAGDTGNLTHFRSFLRRCFKGYPVGYAMEPFRSRHTELAGLILDADKSPDFKNAEDLSRLRTAYRDARNYVLLGDPAVSLTTSVEKELG